MNQIAKRRLAALEAKHADLDKDPALMTLDELVTHAGQLCCEGASSDEIDRYLKHISDKDLAAVIADLQEAIARQGSGEQVEAAP